MPPPKVANLTLELIAIGTPVEPTIVYVLDTDGAFLTDTDGSLLIDE